MSLLKKDSLKNIFLSLLYVSFFQGIYINVIAIWWAYAGLPYFEQSTSLIVSSSIFFIFMFYLTGLLESKTLRIFLIFFLALSAYPFFVGVLYSTNFDDYTKYIYAVAIATPVLLVFFVTNMIEMPRIKIYVNFNLDLYLNVLFFSLFLLVIARFGSSMKFVNIFSEWTDAYDLRNSNLTEGNKIFEKLAYFLGYVLIPYFFNKYMILKKYKYVIFYLSFYLFLFTIGANKTYLMAPIFLIGMHFIFSKSTVVLLLAFTLVMIVFSSMYLFENDALNILAGIISFRIFYTASFVAPFYIEYFGSHGFTYFTQISFFKNTNLAVYKGQEVGQIINDNFFSDSYFNAYFQITDGYTSMGIPGIFIISIVYVGVILLISNIVDEKNTKYFSCFGLSLFALSNSSIFTAMNTGGVFYISLLVFLSSRNTFVKNKHN